MDVDVLLAGIPVGDLKAEQTRMPRRLDCDEFPPPSEVESVMRSDRQSADAVSDPNEGRVHSGDGGERQGFARRVAVNPRYFTVASDESRARFDLTQFDDAFFERLRRRVADAGDRGLSAPALVGRSCW